MPANDSENHHHHHHNDVFNPNPNSNSYPPIHQSPPKRSPKFLPLVLKAIIMVLIISLFFLFLSIATVALLHFFFAGGFLHRRRRRSAADSCTASDLQRFLPRVKYAAGSTAGEDCAVCLEVFREGEWCRSLPDCCHVFHASCVDQWLTKVANCPICRARVRLDSGTTGSAVGDDDCKLLWAIRV